MPRLLKTALLFALASSVGTLAVMPYMAALQPEVFAALPLPLPVVVLLQVVQGLVLFTLLSFLGLRAGAAVGLGAPLVTSWLEPGEGPAQALPLKTLGLALAAGFALALGVAGLDRLFDLPVADVPQPAIWKGALASLYGSISEEVQLRLFLMSVLAWGLSKVGGRDKAWPIVTAIVLAAILFGLGHLPAAFSLWEPSAVVIARTVLLNAMLGMPFGWLYWKYGLEHAMAAHLGADLALHVVVASLA
jgi:hypothetical protein